MLKLFSIMKRNTSVPASALLAIFTLLSLFLVASPVHSALKTGDRCQIKGQLQSIKGRDFTCTKVGKRLEWKRLKSEKVPTTKQPVAAPSPQVLSISERWNQIDTAVVSTALPWMKESQGNTHSVNFIWRPSSNADAEVVDEIKKRYATTAAFWEPLVKVENPILVLIGALNEIEWLCSEKLAWLSWNQPDCVEVERKGERNNPTAGQSQSPTRNVDMYTVDNRRRLDTTGWLARIEHEYVHNVFHALAKSYNNAMPCWMIESGAEYLGIIASSGKDLDRLVMLRNYQVQRQSQNIQGSNLAAWYEFLFRTDRTDIANRQGDSCGPVRDEIYSHALLANEYLVGRLGLSGYLDLVKSAGNVGWSNSVQLKIGMSREELYRQIANYSHRQFEIVIKNPWSYENLLRNL